jgi:hypothetical protein
MLKGLTPEDLRDWAARKIFNRGKDKRYQEIPLLDPEDDLYLELFDDLEEDTDGAAHESDEDDDLDLEDAPRKSDNHF